MTTPIPTRKFSDDFELLDANSPKIESERSPMLQPAPLDDKTDGNAAEISRERSEAEKSSLKEKSPENEETEQRAGKTTTWERLAGDYLPFLFCFTAISHRFSCFSCRVAQVGGLARSLPNPGRCARVHLFPWRWSIVMPLPKLLLLSSVE